MLPVVVLHAMWNANTLYCSQTFRFETAALDVTEILWAGVLDVIVIRLMTGRTD